MRWWQNVLLCAGVYFGLQGVWLGMLGGSFSFTLVMVCAAAAAATVRVVRHRMKARGPVVPELITSADRTQ